MNRRAAWCDLGINRMSYVTGCGAKGLLVITTFFPETPPLRSRLKCVVSHTSVDVVSAIAEGILPEVLQDLRNDT